MSPATPAIFVMGPTASGKTELAQKIVDSMACEIISVDSAMIYRGMNIGTAKPDQRSLANYPHRLIDIRNPVDSYSAAQFRQDALKEMADIKKNGRIPLLVGGTFLYFRALEKGLAVLPAADTTVRARLEEEAAGKGWPAMHEKLAKVDPKSAQRIHANDPQRIQRALEVYELTGESISSFYGKEQFDQIPYNFIKIVLTPDNRAALHERIEQRFAQMLAHGLVDEVVNLRQQWDLHADLPSMRAVGYRQVWDYLEGKWDYNTMQQKAVVATRQYAKRQMTWLRSECNCNWYNSGTDIHKEVLKNLQDSAILSV